MKESTQEIFEALFERYPQLTVCKRDIAAAADLIIEGFRGGKKLLVCGNGGSAADAEHIVGELAKSFKKKRALPLRPFRKNCAATASTARSSRKRWKADCRQSR